MTSCMWLNAHSSAPKSETADSFAVSDCERGTKHSEIPGPPGWGFEFEVYPYLVISTASNQRQRGDHGLKVGRKAM